MYQRLHPKFMQLTDAQIKQSLYESIIDVDSFQNLSSELYNIAMDKFHKNYHLLIQGELQDISSGLKDLYHRHFGTIPPYEIIHYNYNSYSEGLAIALIDAINRIRKSREMINALTGDSKYSDISQFYHDSSIRGLQLVNFITSLYGQTFSFIPFED